MKFQPPPALSPVVDGESSSPFWSVMPTYNPPSGYLERTFRNVLTQRHGPERMQIEVVEDCSPGVDVAAMLKSIVDEQVAGSRPLKNLVLAGCQKIL